jgi:hypothetical protein
MAGNRCRSVIVPDFPLEASFSEYLASDVSKTVSAGVQKSNLDNPTPLG